VVLRIIKTINLKLVCTYVDNGMYLKVGLRGRPNCSKYLIIQKESGAKKKIIHPCSNELLMIFSNESRRRIFSI